MASANYTTWYIVDTTSGKDFKICHTPEERDEYVAELCDKYESDPYRPMITIRIDRHVRSYPGLLM